ncbi:uncharacterized protein MYCFIDRAFT_170266 [Pseudocercospora fijiensis CIRAD86]|uniref:Uncharacterized protein n=1 Tax=Pseudocercospora fijiensis (strain CIRAD86) TaxID=383855 RepID=N1Q7K1_PSEFD|nr:uncharacterized protein MYCFIDRAFT_170266 [Pseudocercospora fijiensis CIRAD86]EME88680.1 hypothetical protein MYCFIDRAFT_170266 [Pseudocercospora fijiensis CIRAD86]
MKYAVSASGIMHEVRSFSLRHHALYLISPGRAKIKALAERDPNRSLASQESSSKKPKQKRPAKSQFEDRSFSGAYEYLCLAQPQDTEELGVCVQVSGSITCLMPEAATAALHL